MHLRVSLRRCSASHGSGGNRAFRAKREFTREQFLRPPRIHHQHLPDSILWEPFGVSKETRAALEAKGHAFAARPQYMGDAEGILIDPATGARLGDSDPRLGGAPAGY